MNTIIRFSLLFAALSLPLMANPITGEINKHRIDGEVTVFISKESVNSVGYSEKKIPTGFVLTEKILNSGAGENSIIKSKIEYEKSDIRPFQTDSISVNGMTAYPAPGDDNWLFPYFDGRVTVYACHPNIRALIYYREESGGFQKLPRRLLTSRDTVSSFGVLPVEPTWIADSISRFPLLFCMYKYDELAAIRQFNELDENKLIPAELGMEFTPRISSIFMSRLKDLSVEIIQEVLNKVPADMILNCRMAEVKLLQNGDLEGAEQHLAIAKRSANSEEFLVYYIEGLLLQESGHFQEALSAYYKSLQYSADYAGDEMKKFRNMLNKRIAKVSKKV